MYWFGWTVTDIAQELSLARSTVESWKQRDRWDQSAVIDRVESSLEARLIQLIIKDVKSGSDFKEIDLLGRQVERLARVRRYEQPGGHEGDLNPAIESRNAAPKKTSTRNVFTDEQLALLRDNFEKTMFGYQRRWYEAGLIHRRRTILKSRQIGATYFFAFEALLDAIDTGRNQVFLSASKSQAHVFKQYIIGFARDVGVELKGDPIVLPNGATLYFLGTNSRTAQGYHGNLYFDEFFWVYQFQTLRKVASGMSIHKRWRQTYFSTPSAVTHDAYPFWNGDQYNRGRKKSDRVEIDISHAALVGGHKCADGVWRDIVTVEDAEREGCDLFDIDALRLEYSAEEWRNLLMCEFVDDTNSVFTFEELTKCLVDSWDVWTDFKPHASRPFASAPVWIGYDPAQSGDGASCAVIAPPSAPGKKFRIIERLQWRGLDYMAQADEMRKLTKRYNVAHMGIDASGVGQGVYDAVTKFFPRATRINYSVETKTALVLKAKDVISSGRLEFDAGWKDLVAAFLTITRTLTASQRHMTFEASRTRETGHADLAWAVMHALINEPLSGNDGSTSSIMEIYS